MGLPRWLQVLEQVGPTVLMFTPLAPIAPAVVAGIKVAEAIPGATGPQKKALVQQIAGLAAAGANAQAGKTVVDPTSLEAVSGQAIDTVIGVVNLTHILPEVPPPIAP